MMSNKTLIYIAGPTGIGKTKLSIYLAKKFQTEIISCDSRQFYKEMRIGTAVPTKDQLKEVKHHFIQNKSIHDDYKVGDFEKDAINKIGDIFKNNDKIIMVGGSGLYADAVMFGLDEFPKVPSKVRGQIYQFYQTHGLKSLQQLLLEKDPKYYSRVDKNNPVRLLRALEICIVSDRPYTSFLRKNENKREFVSKMVVLNCERSLLYSKINKRVDSMLALGLEFEAKKLLEYRSLTPLKTVGYKEFFPYFDGDVSFENAVSEIKKNTRRYAKRQITWIKKYKNAITLLPNTTSEEAYRLLDDN